MGFHVRRQNLSENDREYENARVSKFFGTKINLPFDSIFLELFEAPSQARASERSIERFLFYKLTACWSHSLPSFPFKVSLSKSKQKLGINHHTFL